MLRAAPLGWDEQQTRSLCAQAFEIQPGFLAPMAAANSTPPGSLDLNQPGFSREILGTKLEVKYLCSECKNILRRPFQAQCGHRYCSYCLKKIISSGPQKCAICIQEGIYEEGISILETSSAFPDNAARREVESLPAICINDGCTWKGTIKEYEAHDEVCPKFPLTCEGCGKKKIPREKFQDHVKTCGKCKVPCRFQVVGCAEMVENEKLSEHESKCLEEHLYMLQNFVLSLKTASGGLKHHPALSSSQSNSSLLAANALCSESELSKPLELLRRCEALERKTVTFENIVCVLNREVERVSLTAEAYSRQHRLDQEKIETLSNKVRQLERSIGLKDLAMAEMEEKIRNLEASTYDGVFIWKITEFARKRQEAITGRSPAIFSPAFYTSKYGYKMCLRVYLNGDGTGRGTHLSLFFVVMKGPNDALLRWPFNQKVTLMLLDQNNREHIIDAFRPDVTSSSFQRPITEMNIASGCPLFCPVSVMEAKNSYVRDDAIFIKAIVDLTGL
ncbi:TNF receptor-associated factor 2 isoform X5 [Rhea pennata]|uniref:TNF receptor-associated factor 2 isoform X5 n=1 Tax=Rhea pennata TaxID=8795 RepID=UPI002E25340F